MKTNMLVALSAAALLVAACETTPYQGEHRRTATGATIGAGAGAILGSQVASSGSRTEGGLIGAAIGATVGGLVGRQMDQQERELRQQMQGTGVDVQREGDTIRLQAPSNITFDTNRAEVKSEFRPVLDQLAQSIQQYPNTIVRIEGHTDSTGSSSYNQTLSENRAQSVGSYLSQRGVGSDRLQPVGFGQTRPIASNDTTEGRAQNRRVEILLVPLEEPVQQ